MEEQITIILADDHPLFRSGVKHELESNTGFKVIGEANNGEEAIKLIINLNPTIAVLDIQMPELSGLEVARNSDIQNSSTSIILLTMFDDQKTFYEAMDAEVKGYVLKDDAVNDIVTAVCLVAQGKHYISPALSDILLLRTNHSPDEKINLHIKSLTPTERNILKLISELKSNDEIAEELFISKRTVENHKVSIAAKLELGGARHLLKFALKNKLSL
ncbi:MAG: response regulator transcription factor [bacterium]